MKQNLIEAALDWSTQERKMRELDAGTRGFNAAAANDDKLRFNQKVCQACGLSTALYVVETEMLKRGLISSRSNSTKSTTTSSSSSTTSSSSSSTSKMATEIEEAWKNISLLNLPTGVYIVDIFNKIEFDTVKNHSGTSKELLNKALLHSAGSIIFYTLAYLVFAILLDRTDLTPDLSYFITNNYGCPKTELKRILNEVSTNHDIMAKLADFIETNESLDAKSIFVEALEKTTPYMLRNDGAFLACGEIHPYIKMQYKQSFEDTYKALLTNYEFLDWFYYNTNNQRVKDLICKFLSICEQKDTIIELKDKIGIVNTLTTADDTIENILNELNDLTNQEFCRARTSNFKYKYGGDNGEIYFRISSKNFNWFDLIYQVVSDYSVSIKYVTIMKDYAATGERFAYISYKGKDFNKMPINEFLSLPGNPIVESLDEIYTNSFELEEDIEKHETLNPKLWDGDKLKPEVEEKINLIVDEFLEGLEKDDIKIDVKDIIIIGSNCSYNYTKDSDIDIHIIADTHSLDKNSELYDKLYSAYRSLFNKKIDVEFYDIPVELYIETNETPRVSNGCYSVMNKSWIKEPVATDIPDIDKDAFNKEFKKWEDRYLKIVNKAEDKLDEKITTPQLELIANYIDDIYELRKNSLAEAGEYSIGNLVFKEIRNKGYLDNLKDLKNQLISQELSLYEAKKAAIEERLNDKDRINYRNELSRLSFNQAVIQDNGLFHIYNVKEDDCESIKAKIRRLNYIEWVQSSAGRFDLSKAMIGGLPSRYYTIYGKIKD